VFVDGDDVGDVAWSEGRLVDGRCAVGDGVEVGRVVSLDVQFKAQGDGPAIKERRIEGQAGELGGEVFRQVH